MEKDITPALIIGQEPVQNPQAVLLKIMRTLEARGRFRDTASFLKSLETGEIQLLEEGGGVIAIDDLAKYVNGCTQTVLENLQALWADKHLSDQKKRILGKNAQYLKTEDEFIWAEEHLDKGRIKALGENIQYLKERTQFEWCRLYLSPSDILNLGSEIKNFKIKETFILYYQLREIEGGTS